MKFKLIFLSILALFFSSYYFIKEGVLSERKPAQEESSSSSSASFGFKKGKKFSLFSKVFKKKDKNKDARTKPPRGSIAPITPFTKGPFSIEYAGDFPRPRCRKIGISQEKACFLGPKKGFGRKSLIIDPGHEDSIISVRSRGHKVMHEGRMNLATAFMIKDILHRCYDAPLKSIKLTRWPGEKSFGQYRRESKTNKSNFGGGKIRPSSGGENIRHDGEERTSYIEDLIGRDRRSLILSLHHNTSGADKNNPRYCRKVKDPKIGGVRCRAESVKALHGQTGSNIDESTRVAKSLVKEVRDSTLKYYTDDDFYRSKTKFRKNSKVDRVSTVNITEGFGKYDETPVILLENFFMDGQMAEKVNPKDVQSFKVMKVFYKKKNEVKKRVQIGPDYKVSDINIDVAIGVVRGLLKSFPCAEE